MAYIKPLHPERVYVKVNSDFDSTGYMQPRSITWKDGRVFNIEAVKDFILVAVNAFKFFNKVCVGSCLFTPKLIKSVYIIHSLNTS